MKRNLLLLSSSKVKDSPYLEHAADHIKQTLGDIKQVLFIPYAGVTIDSQQYTQQVRNSLKTLSIEIVNIEECACPIEAVNSAQAILVGGGNTFRLLERLYHHQLIEPIRERVLEQVIPYIGWSAGSNIAGLTIKTTNDMPIIQPPSFVALQLVNAQLNPHYSEFKPKGFNGETREQRLAEFMVLEPSALIIGLIEGTGLKVSENSCDLVQGKDINEPVAIFNNGAKKLLAQLPSDLVL